MDSRHHVILCSRLPSCLRKREFSSTTGDIGGKSFIIILNAEYDAIQLTCVLVCEECGPFHNACINKALMRHVFLYEFSWLIPKAQLSGKKQHSTRRWAIYFPHDLYTLNKKERVWLPCIYLANYLQRVTHHPNVVLYSMGVLSHDHTVLLGLASKNLFHTILFSLTCDLHCLKEGSAGILHN